MTTASTFFSRSRKNARDLIDALHSCLHDLEEYQIRGGSNFSDNVDPSEYEAYGLTLAEFDYYMAQLADYAAAKNDTVTNPAPRERALFAALLLVADAY